MNSIDPKSGGWGEWPNQSVYARRRIPRLAGKRQSIDNWSLVMFHGSHMSYDRNVVAFLRPPSVASLLIGYQEGLEEGQATGSVDQIHSVAEVDGGTGTQDANLNQHVGNDDVPVAAAAGNTSVRVDVSQPVTELEEQSASAPVPSEPWTAPGIWMFETPASNTGIQQSSGSSTTPSSTVAGSGSSTDGPVNMEVDATGSDAARQARIDDSQSSLGSTASRSNKR